MRDLTFIAILLVLTSCGTQKIISYEYNVVTRGYKNNIIVTQDSTKIIEVSRDSKTSTIATTSIFWKALQSESKNIKLNEIGKLKSPTNKRQYDGAMFAKLILTTEDSAYTSAGFDNGHPPVMIKTVVDSLVNLSVK